MFPGLNFGGSSPRDPDGRAPDTDRLGIAFAIDEPVSVMSPVVFASPHSGRLYPPAFLNFFYIKFFYQFSQCKNLLFSARIPSDKRHKIYNCIR